MHIIPVSERHYRLLLAIAEAVERRAAEVDADLLSERDALAAKVLRLEDEADYRASVIEELKAEIEELKRDAKSGGGK